MDLAPDFVPELAEYNLDALDEATSTVFGVRPNLTIGFRNRAWFRFWADNDGGTRPWDDGPILNAFSEDLRSWYAGLYARVRLYRIAEEHEYSCPTPTMDQVFRARILPLRRGLLLIHTLLKSSPTLAAGPPEDVARYRDGDGIVTQCSHCRRTRRVRDPATWDWVPAYLDRAQTDVSHGLCPCCFEVYYPQLAARRRAQRTAALAR